MAKCRAHEQDAVHIEHGCDVENQHLRPPSSHFGDRALEFAGRCNVNSDPLHTKRSIRPFHLLAHDLIKGIGRFLEHADPLRGRQ